MASLSYCLDKLGGRISDAERSMLTKAAERYRGEGYEGKDANYGAVHDAIKDLADERSDIINQVKNSQEYKDWSSEEGSETKITQSDKAQTAGSSDKIATDIAARIRTKKKTDWRKLFNIADKHFGKTQAEGGYTPKDAYDAVEVGVNRVIEGNIKTKVNEDVKGAKGVVSTLKKLMGYLPTQTKRTDEQQKFQQFSTPPPLAYAVNWVANINNSDVYLEPSAGVGGLAIFGRKAGAKTIIANELSPRRLDLIKLLGFDKYFNENAEQINNILPKNIKPTVVVMNPPFSATGGRVSKNQTKYGAKHIEQALARLEDGGRLVAIVGRGMAMDRPTFKSWWKKIQNKYTVRANVGVSGKGYAKYGTQFDNQVLVIDKIGPSDYATVTGYVENVEDLIDTLGDVRNERKSDTKVEQPSSEQTGEKGIGETQEEAVGTPPTQPSTDTLAEGQQAGEGGGPKHLGHGGPTGGGPTGLGDEGSIPTGTPGGSTDITGTDVEESGPATPGGTDSGVGISIPDGDRSDVLQPGSSEDISIDELSDLIDEVLVEEGYVTPETSQPETPATQPIEIPNPGDVVRFEDYPGKYITGRVKSVGKYVAIVELDEDGKDTSTTHHKVPSGPLATPFTIVSKKPTKKPSVKKAAKHAAKGTLKGLEAVADIMKGLNEYGAIGHDLPPLVAPEAYKQAKKHLAESYAEYVAAGNELKEWVRHAIKGLIELGGKPGLAKNWVLNFYAHDRPKLKKAEKPVKIRVEISNEKEDNSTITESIFEDYKPSKVRIPGSKTHMEATKTPLVESAAMASVPAPDPTYEPTLLRKIVDRGLLSLEQLEAVIMSGQAHSQTLPNGERKGFFIGDGTGVGKGRTIAGIMADNWNQGRKKSIWISKNGTLIKDAKRDAKNIEFNAPVFLLNKTKGKTVKEKEGVMFVGYDTLYRTGQGENFNRDNIQGRLKQMVDWVGIDFDGVIAFDEAHKMGNAMEIGEGINRREATKTAQAAMALQQALPNARIVYVSATGATEVNNLAYAERLGLWGEGTEFPNKRDFVTKMAQSGIPAMELIAQGMKAQGSYLARALSYDGVEYEKLVQKLTDKQKDIYNELAQAWQVVLGDIDAALGETGGVFGKSQFWNTHQRFFNQILTALTMPAVVKSIEKDMAEGRSSVIQLVNTQEAAQKRAIGRAAASGESLEFLDLSPINILMDYVGKSFPVQQFEDVEQDDGSTVSMPVFDSEGNPVFNAEAVEMRDQLLENLSLLSEKTPGNPLDVIIEKFGVENVAEVTGRDKRVINGKLQKHGPAKRAGDIKAFQDGEKRILIFSDAGGTGASYHADVDAKNQQKRHHYILQAGWQADKATQGFGRTHRSNQKQPPKYHLVTTDLHGHKRFITSIARRLDQLGALTKGQRETGSQGFFSSTDNLETTYSSDALDWLIRDIYNGDVEGMSIEGFENETKLKILKTDDSGEMYLATPTVKQFLNRLLNMTVDQQNKTFEAFETRLNELYSQADARGLLDKGIETIKAESAKVVEETELYKDPVTGAQAKLISMDTRHKRDLFTWDGVHEWYFNDKNKRFKYGYWVNKNSGTVFGAHPAGTVTQDNGAVERRVAMKTITGKSYALFALRKDLHEGEESKYREVSKAEAEELWNKQYDETDPISVKRQHMATGVILPIWKRIMGPVKVRRIQTDDGKKFIGRLLSEAQARMTKENLGIHAGAPQITPKQGVEMIMEEDATLKLANGWIVKRRMVSGEDRIEIVGNADASIGDEIGWLRDTAGAFTEMIEFKTRAFVPTGKKSAGVLKKLMDRYPVLDIERAEREAPAIAQPSQQGSRPSRVVRMSLNPTQNDDITLKMVQKMFPGANVGFKYLTSKDPFETIYVRFPDGNKINIYSVSHISPNEVYFNLGYGRRRKAGETIKGAFVNGNIYLTKDNSGRWTLAHEGEHALEEMGYINTRDVKALTDRIKELVESGQWVSQNKKDIGGSEDRAEFVAQQLKARTEGGRIGRIIQKIADLIDGLINLHHRTARGVIRDIESGKITRKAGTKQNLKESYGTKLNTATKAFNRWFGKSKVVDENGEPLVVYHGTTKDFAAFSPKKVGSNTYQTDTREGDAFFFTDNPDFAGDFSFTGYPDGGQILPVYIKLENPYIMELPKATPGGIAKAIKYAKDNGHDGVALSFISSRNLGQKGTGNFFIAFNPTQIKSVYNRGTFDPKNPDIRYTYAGLGAQTADKGAFANAVFAHEVMGEDKKKIREDTGWFLGPDDKWRFEIDDSKVRWTTPFQDLEEAKNYYLDELVNDDWALMDAYPELGDVVVIKMPLHGGLEGQYFPNANTIHLDSSLSNKQALNTAIHEIQHWVQFKESFAKGGMVERSRILKATKKLGKIYARYLSRAQSQLKASKSGSIERKSAELLINKVKGKLKLLGQLNEIEDELKKSADKIDALLEKQKKVEKELKDEKNKLDDIIDKIGENRDTPLFVKAIEGKLKIQATLIEVWKKKEVYAAIEKQDKMLRPYQELAFDAYKALAGEVESRDAAARAKMSEYARKRIAPYQSQGLKADEMLVEFTDFLDETENDVAMYSVSMPESKEELDDIYEGTNPERRKRLEGSRGLGSIKWIQDVKDQIKTGYKAFRRARIDLDPNTEGHFLDILRLFQEAPGKAKEDAYNILRGIMGGLETPKSKRIFELSIIMDDMIADLDNGVLEEGEDMPFGFQSQDEIEEFRARLEEKSPDVVKDALAERKDYMDSLRQELVDNKILPEKVLESDAYFHHQVMIYRAVKEMGDEYRVAPGLSPEDLRMKKKGWQIARKGSNLDYNTDYLEPEFEVISQALLQLETKEVMDRLKGMADVHSQSVRDAKDANDAKFEEIAGDAAEEMLKPFSAQIARANLVLARMAKNGNLDFDAEYTDLVEDLANSYESWKNNQSDWQEAIDDNPQVPWPGVQDERWFPFLSHLMANGYRGSGQAGKIYKAIWGRKKKIKQVVGKDFKAWDDFIPEGFTDWQAKPEGIWFRVNTLPDHLIERIKEGAAELPPELNKVWARAGAAPWVIPKSLARALDNYRDIPDPHPAAKASRKAIAAWKIWTLINPFRLFKYNANNTSGDADIALAYDPKILTQYTHKAGNVLLKQFRNKPLTDTESKKLEDARQHAITGSGWSLQEITEIADKMSKDKFIKAITLEDDTFIKKGWNLTGGKYWQFAKDFTTTRENVLRLAAYWYFQDKIAAGRKPGENLIAASNKKEIQSLVAGGATKDEQAAKLARELIGDYGNISEAGRWLRAQVIPFWSWMEINSPRYVRMLKNAKYEGTDVGNIAKVGAKKAAWRTTAYGVRAMALYSAVMLYNHLRYPDEEDELGEAGRRQLHLITGRRSDGSIRTLRFQGAFSDMMSLVGLEDFPQDVSDLVSGRKTPARQLEETVKAPINRLGTSMRPMIKTGFEAASQRSFYPDVFAPRPVRDRIGHIARTFSLNTPYSWAMGKPKQGNKVTEQLWQDFTKLFFYYSEPGEGAYYSVKKWGYDFIDDNNLPKYSGIPNSKSNALYYYKQSLKYGDLKAAEKYLKLYMNKYGGTTKGMKLSITSTHPLASIKPVKYRAKFLETLDPKQRQTYDRAVQWYQKTYGASLPTKQGTKYRPRPKPRPRPRRVQK